MNNIINNKYTIIEKIGVGSFGTIYKGKHNKTDEVVAIKIEPISSKYKLLKNETFIYHYLNKLNCIPKLKWFGKDTINYYMVIDLLGPSLRDIIEKYNKNGLSLLFTLEIGIKIMNILKSIHDNKLIHRDIKPDNFLFGLNDLKDIYLIDYGFCVFYTNHCDLEKTSHLVGSLNYASINAHNCFKLSMRDDLESVCYLLFYLHSGKLLWQEFTNECDILNAKIEIINNIKYPSILLDLLKYARNLNYNEYPKYYWIINNMKTQFELLQKQFRII
jgi:serine/threonine protein kinase